MDFKIKKVADQILIKIAQVRFTIRLSILSIVLTLLVGVSVVIISINYFSINSILVASARSSLLQASGKVAEEISHYLQPLNDNTLTAYRMLDEGVITPQSPLFTRFLASLIIDDTNIVGAYWGDTHGNIYWINKENQRLFEEIILREHNQTVQATAQYFDPRGKQLLATGNLADPDFDPRLRPWYQQAQARKGLTWIVYRFAAIGNQPPQLGVTSAFPIYDAEGNLQGVFGNDMLLGAIVDYLKEIELTSHSFIFVINFANGDLLAAHTRQKRLSTFDTLPNITDTKLPCLIESFKIYQQNQTSPFVYSVGGKKYIAAYKKILGVSSDSPWLVAVVTPVNDIIAPLLQSIFINTIFTVLVLILGIILASVFSASLSRPIKTLAQDATLICQLQLDGIKHLFSRIREIAEMADSFIKMKNALYSFQRYMPITLVKKLILSGKVATVGGEAKELTLLFTDVRNFTQLSENFEPEQLMQYLSEYFQSITKVIMELHGTVDKYIGDGVMAFWGAPIDDPDHVSHACLAAIQIQQALQQLNLKWRSEGKPEIVTHIGISTGRVVVGNVGSDYKLNYTSIGDSVNLASRLEELNKIYGTTIIISDFVYEKVKEQFRFRLLDRVAVKGKTRGGYIYELLGERTSTTALNYEQYNQEFAQAFTSYEQGNWQEALSQFQDLRTKYPLDQVAPIFITRLNHFVEYPPAVWNGVWFMEEK